MWPSNPLHPYLALLRTPRLTTAYLAVGLSALPLGMINLAVVVSVHRWTGSLALAGWLSGAFTAANAIGLALQGRLLDRFGTVRVIRVAAAGSGTALAAAVVTGTRAPANVLLLAVWLVLAGIGVPAITTAVRGRLPQELADPAHRTAGYALLSVLFQIAITVGPLLVSVGVLLDAAWAALLGASVLLVAAGALATGGDSLLRGRSVTVEDTLGGQTRTWWTAGFLAVLTVAVLTGIASGVTAVAVPGLTASAGVAALAGAIFSAVAVGDVCGALAYGSRRWPLTLWSQLGCALLVAAAVSTVAYAVAAQPLALVPVMFAGGLLAAPAAITMSTLLDEVVAPWAIGRAYGLLVSVGLVAAALGNIIAGSLAGAVSPRGLLLLTPVALVAAAGIGFSRIRR